MLELLNQYWVAILVVGLVLLLGWQAQGCRRDFSEGEINSGAQLVNDGGFTVILPKTVDFKGAQVSLVSGLANYNRINQSGRIDFDLPPGARIDKIKVRTGGGKEYNYAEQTNPGHLLVDPIPCYDCSLNSLQWRH